MFSRHGPLRPASRFSVVVLCALLLGRSGNWIVVSTKSRAKRTPESFPTVGDRWLRRHTTRYPGLRGDDGRLWTTSERVGMQRLCNVIAQGGRDSGGDGALESQVEAMVTTPGHLVGVHLCTGPEGRCESRPGDEMRVSREQLVNYRFCVPLSDSDIVRESFWLNDARGDPPGEGPVSSAIHRNAVAAPDHSQLRCLLVVAARVARTGDRVCGLLIRHGARVDRPDGGGLTALHIAAQLGNEAAVRVLVQMGASSTLRTPDGWLYQGLTPSNLALRHGHNRAAAMIEDGPLSPATDVLPGSLFEVTAPGAVINWRVSPTSSRLGSLPVGAVVSVVETHYMPVIPVPLLRIRFKGIGTVASVEAHLHSLMHSAGAVSDRHSQPTPPREMGRYAEAQAESVRELGGWVSWVSRVHSHSGQSMLKPFLTDAEKQLVSSLVQEITAAKPRRSSGGRTRYESSLRPYAVFAGYVLVTTGVGFSIVVLMYVCLTVEPSRARRPSASQTARATAAEKASCNSAAATT
eukprot:COSAG01_NODE_2226_length_8132_cov_3.669862_9_plen_519_part_01